MPEKRPLDTINNHMRVMKAMGLMRCYRDMQVRIANLNLSPYPLWEANTCHFVNKRIDQHQFMSHFYSRPHQTYGSKKGSYANVFEHVAHSALAQPLAGQPHS